MTSSAMLDTDFKMPSGLYRSNITAVGVSDGPWYDWNLRGEFE